MRNLFTKNNFFYAKVIILLIILFFPIFDNLGGQVMMRWDEARYADSSYEMLRGKNPFVVTYQSHPDLESTKPPLLHWLQSVSIALFGFNEVAVRLPSAVAGLFICLALVIFTKRKFNSFSLGAIASLILVTTPEGFAGIDHSIRTADYDGLLALLAFTGVLHFFLYNENTQKTKHLFLSAVFFTLAVITKGPAGLFYLPGLFIYALIRKNLFSLFKSKWFYFSALTFVLCVGFIFLIREYYSPGYLAAFNKMEFLGRHNTVQDGHEGGWFFYIEHFTNERFGNWFVFIPLGWIAGYLSKEKTVRSYSIFSFILSISYYLVISSSASKLAWYDLQLFPLLALQAAIFIWIVCRYLSSFINIKTGFNKTAIHYIILLLVFVSPYKDSVVNATTNNYTDAFIGYNNIQCYLKREPELAKNGIIIVSDEAPPCHYLFYCYKLNDKGFNLKIELYLSNYKSNDKLICDDPEYQEQIEQNYQVEIIDTYSKLKVYGIIDKKHNS